MTKPIDFSATDRSESITIVGAGVIGLSLAWELACRGARVRIVERGHVGRETSWAAGGILPAARLDTALDPIDRLRGLSHRLYPTWAGRLHSLTGIDPGLRQCGGIYLASSPAEAAVLLAWQAYQQELGIEMASLESQQLASIEPSIQSWARSDRFLAAIHSPAEWQVRPPDLLAALVAACRSAGVQIDQQLEVHLTVNHDVASLSIEHQDSRVEVIRDSPIVICGGAWSGQIAANLGLANCVIPIRGQMLMYRYAEAPLRHIINEGHRYLVARDDGRVIIGSCEEEVGFARGTTPEMLEPLARWAESILPSLIGMTPEKTWSGLRPATFDGFPMIGKLPNVGNLSIATGHYRSGIHLAPATATVMADLLLDEPLSLELAAFDAGRMIDRTTPQS